MVENDVFWFASHSLLSLLLYVTRDHLPRGGGAHRGMALLHQSLIKKMPHRFASDGGMFSIETPSSQITLPYVILKEIQLLQHTYPGQQRCTDMYVRMSIHFTFTLHITSSQE